MRRLLPEAIPFQISLRILPPWLSIDNNHWDIRQRESSQVHSIRHTRRHCIADTPNRLALLLCQGHCIASLNNYYTMHLRELQQPLLAFFFLRLNVLISHNLA